MTDTDTCATCGALMGNEIQHKNWHNWLEQQLRQAKADPDPRLWAGDPHDGGYRPRW